MYTFQHLGRACCRYSVKLNTHASGCYLLTTNKSYAAPAKRHIEFRAEEGPNANNHLEVTRLLNNQSDVPGEKIALFVKHAGQMLEYNRVVDVRSPLQQRREHLYKPQISRALVDPVSIEDYLYRTPEPTQPLPNITKLPGIYASLSKSKLTMLVVMTAMGGYAMAPGVFDWKTLALLTAGTTLQSAAANSTNQIIEVKYDTQMHRTRNRVLVRGLISRQHAAAFAAASGITGTALLYYGVNPLACYIGAANYFLYTSIYTPMKRKNIMNTWVGSVVGALPPIMGWAAATGSVDIGGLWLGVLLYIWQFPHFKALSWNIRKDYQRAGYQMTAVSEPDMCKRVAFRHTILMTLACCLGPVVDCTTNMFIITSLPCNLYGVYLGWRFYSHGDSNSARSLFRFSLVQMPYLILVMIMSKTMMVLNDKWSNEENEKAESKDAVTAIS